MSNAPRALVAAALLALTALGAPGATAETASDCVSNGYTRQSTNLWLGAEPETQPSRLIGDHVKFTFRNHHSNLRPNYYRVRITDTKELGWVSKNAAYLNLC